MCSPPTRDDRQLFSQRAVTLRSRPRIEGQTKARATGTARQNEARNLLERRFRGLRQSRLRGSGYRGDILPVQILLP